MFLGFAGSVLLNDSTFIQDLACAIDIISEKLGHIVGKVLPNHNSHYFDIRCIIGQAVCRDYPPFFSYLMGELSERIIGGLGLLKCNYR